MILPSAYLPPVSWFSALLREESVLIEQHENYQKQTIRNRCTIDSPNGPLNLSIPVDRSIFTGGKCLMKDVRISDHNDWQHQHWYALETSYFNSPFFEYLQDDLRPLYERKWDFLIDFNEALINKCCEMLDVQPNISRTSYYMGIDFVVNSQLSTVNYYQVFQQKHGFLPNLSIIDLIFNMGPESVLVLQSQRNTEVSR
ncbi:MAG: WbqC family protein [Bacteroidaceae bacterium]|nr:WbqC family protein [Bacteroidaceae bacterium]